MDKRGTLLHWTIFGVLAALGFFVVLSAELDVGNQFHAGWAIGFYDGVLEGEKELLNLGMEARFLAQEVSDEIGAKIDTGCGVQDGFMLLNMQENFCVVNIEDEFADSFSERIGSELGEGYDVVILDGFVHGKISTREEVKSSPDSLIFKDVFDEDRLLIKPFDYTYSYVPSFSFALPGIVGKMEGIREVGKGLYVLCYQDADLKKCLDEALPSIWEYGECDVKGYFEVDRKVLFCAEGHEFMVDFSS